MITSTLVKDLQAKGVHFNLDGEQIKINAPHGTITPELHQLLAQRKTELLTFLKRPVDRIYYRERFAERSAIMEVDGELPSEEAQLQAFHEVLHEYLTTHYPSIMEEYGRVIFGERRVH